MQKKIQKKAFSLIELSIVILIVSILITGSLGVSKSAINSNKNRVTKDRMDVIYKALSNFVAANRRLPCPALLNAIKGATAYGNESATPGTCTGTYISSNATNLAYGMLPIKALGLDTNMAEDGFGTKFTYVIDKRFSKASSGISATDGFEIVQGVANENAPSADLSSIDVQGPSGTSLSGNKNFIFLLLSHGANKFKGFGATSSIQDSTTASNDENNNGCDETLPCNTASTGSYNRVFVSYSTDPNFDDILLFKTKAQIIRDAGLQYTMCAASEANTASYTWSSINRNATTGCTASSDAVANLCVKKTCGQYGVWGVASTATSGNCGSTCSW